ATIVAVSRTSLMRVYWIASAILQAILLPAEESCWARRGLCAPLPKRRSSATSLRICQGGAKQPAIAPTREGSVCRFDWDHDDQRPGLGAPRRRPANRPFRGDRRRR